MRNFIILIIFTILMTLSSFAWSKQIQIIHTNDLHSYFVGIEDGRGGYSKVKTIIDNLKSEAKAKGIESIVLDGGDWGEGTSFFLVDEGVSSIKALGLLGIDVTVMGNHDHMMGGAVLSEQIRRANVETKILSANLIQTPEMNLKDIVIPTTQVIVDGVKLGIIGLSTPEPHHQGALLPGLIVPPETIMFPYTKKLKQDNDAVVAVTHLGTAYDKRIAKLSKNIDVIIGGHSHERLDEIVYKKNKNNYEVPIVQTGAHGVAVGSMIIDVTDKKVKVIDYKLHDVLADTLKDNDVENFVQESIAKRNDLFGGRFDEVIGVSEVDLDGYINGKSPKKPTCWGEHLARITRQAANADIGIHLHNFSGMYFPKGEVTLGMLIDNYPHFRNYGDQGWEVSTFTLKGKVLKKVLRGILALQEFMGINVDGFDYAYFIWPDFVPWIAGRAFPFNLKIKGKKIDKDKEYTVAIPTEIEYVLRKLISKRSEKLLPKLKGTGQYYWPHMEKYVIQNSPIKCQ